MKRTFQVLIAIALSFLFISSAQGSESETFILARKTATSWTFNLNEGSRVVGSILIQGGTQSDLDVWVADPAGTIVVTFGVLKNQSNIEFTANQTGAYRLHLNNGGNALADSEKTVTVSYEIESSLRQAMSVGFALAIVAVAILVIGFYLWRKLTRTRVHF